MGIYTLNASIKPTFTLFILKKIAFYVSFILYLNFCKFKNHLVLQDLYFIISYIAIISYIPQINQIALTIGMCQENVWETLTAITFPYYLTGKKRYDPLDYFGMGIMEEIRFFFFDMEDPARNRKLCVKSCGILKNKVCGL